MRSEERGQCLRRIAEVAGGLDLLIRLRRRIALPIAMIPMN